MVARSEGNIEIELEAFGLQVDALLWRAGLERSLVGGPMIQGRLMFRLHYWNGSSVKPKLVGYHVIGVTKDTEGVGCRWNECDGAEGD